MLFIPLLQQKKRASLLVRHAIRLFGLIALVSFAGCTSGDRSTPGPAIRRESERELEVRLKELSAQIQKAQGTSRCNQDSDCRVRGLGTRVCGEFRDYLVYSSLDAREWELGRLVEEFNSTHSRLAQTSLGANSCGTPPARVVCVSHHCEPLQQ